jgi:predicted metal-dependent hydrolase
MIRLASTRALFRRPTEPSAIAVETEASVYLVQVRRDRRARRFTLRVHPVSREAVLTMPPRSPLTDAQRFAQAHVGWLAARLGSLPKAMPFVDGGMLPLRGVPHRIVHRPDSRGTVWTECDESGDPLLIVAGGEAHVSRRVHDFLKRQARHDLQSAAARYAQTLDVRIVRMSIRDQSSRWGSCTSAGVLSFSWRLILAPPEVLDYLAAHEVAHLVEMNHSARFWRVVDRICPHTASAKAWINTHGNDLHRYGLHSDFAA